MSALSSNLFHLHADRGGLGIRPMGSPCLVGPVRLPGPGPVFSWSHLKPEFLSTPDKDAKTFIVSKSRLSASVLH